MLKVVGVNFENDSGCLLESVNIKDSKQLFKIRLSFRQLVQLMTQITAIGNEFNY